MYTHIFILTPESEYYSPKLKVRDFATCIDTEIIGKDVVSKISGNYLMEGTWFEFAEDPGMWYHEKFVAELPAPKTVYVEMDKKVKKVAQEVCIN